MKARVLLSFGQTYGCQGKKLAYIGGIKMETKPEER